MSNHLDCRYNCWATDCGAPERSLETKLPSSRVMLNGVQFKAVLRALGSEIDYIHDDIDFFMKQFARGGDWWMLEDVTFSDEQIRVYYILESGRHIVTEEKIEVYLEWRRANY